MITGVAWLYLILLIAAGLLTVAAVKYPTLQWAVGLLVIVGLIHLFVR